MMVVLFPTFMVHTLQNDVVVRNTFSVCIFVAQTERLISQCRWTVLKEQKASSYKECIVLSQELCLFQKCSHVAVTQIVLRTHTVDSFTMVITHL